MGIKDKAITAFVAVVCVAWFGGALYGLYLGLRAPVESMVDSAGEWLIFAAGRVL